MNPIIRGLPSCFGYDCCFNNIFRKFPLGLNTKSQRSTIEQGAKKYKIENKFMPAYSEFK